MRLFQIYAILYVIYELGHKNSHIEQRNGKDRSYL